MSFTAYATAIAGSVLTAAFWNAQVKNNGLVLKTSIDDNGHLTLPVVQSKSANYTALITDDVVLATSGTWTLTLPTVASAVKRTLIVKNLGAGTITIDANGAETIDGALTQGLFTQYQAMTLYSDGSVWHIV